LRASPRSTHIPNEAEPAEPRRRVPLQGLGMFGYVGPGAQKPPTAPRPEQSFAPRFSPYVLRHIWATLLLLLGVAPLTVTRRLRHKEAEE
jgi:integrase